jgi:hypothetical protein
LIVLNSIFPVFGLIFLGALLKKFRLTNEAFLATSDRLIYFVFFPLMLFWKIGGASSAGVNWSFCAAVLCALLLAFGISALCIRFFGISDYEAGSFSQSCYRFNTYIGMAILMNAMGEESVRLFGILIGFMIPLINVMAVSTLIWYSGKAYAAAERNRLLLRSLISNPLILGCLAGIVYGEVIGTFPVFLDNTLRLTSLVTLPLALISIGGGLRFSSFRDYRRQSLLAAAVKLALLPVVGFFCLQFFGISGMPFRVGMIYFALPTSTAIYVLSSQLHSDTALASAAIVISTLLSMISLGIVLTFIR